MSPRSRSTPADPVEARLDDIAKLLAVLVARDRTLQDAIGEMDAFGIPQSRIAGLVGKSQGYVNVSAERYKGKGKKGSSKGRDAPED